jgi:hypothetical protein
MGIGGFLVKANLTVAPGLLPEFIVAPGHGDFFLSGEAESV